MSFEIEGKSGQKLEVSNRNMAHVLSLAKSIQADAALVFQRAWTFSATVTPGGAGNVFAYVRNGSVRDMLITRVQLAAVTAETVTLNAYTGTAAGGTVIASVNRVVGSSRIPAQGLVTQGATSITGLTASGTLESLRLPAVTRVAIDSMMERPIVLRPGFAIGIAATTGGISITWLLDLCEQVVEPAEVL